MTESISSLFLVSLHLDIRRSFAEAAEKRLPLRELDIGYLVHCHLKDLFGDLAPKPFFVRKQRDAFLRIVGYTNVPKDALKTHADQFSQTRTFSACRWETLEDKQMPAIWKPGMVVGFETCVCPTQRMANDGLNHSKGAEVDVFLAQCWKAGSPNIPIDREIVYRDWLNNQFERLGGSRLKKAALVGFQRGRFCRRTQGEPRKAHRTERPEAWMKGLLEITNSEGFLSLLKRGIGRHRAFGFGMLLLRPANLIC
ncbi:MAG: type I-E CRISPR-associated protein Cas6/Cse3/CasE [Candidatus Riflebacteria bacterium]|nr:type I-E CRISPR-associated protein Cas6/Cse3/CasE [Candidatus Riflebacteria bacterium]